MLWAYFGETDSRLSSSSKLLVDQVLPPTKLYTADCQDLIILQLAF